MGNDMESYPSDIIDIQKSEDSCIISLKGANIESCDTYEVVDGIYVHVDLGRSCICAVELARDKCDEISKEITKIMTQMVIKKGDTELRQSQIIVTSDKDIAKQAIGTLSQISNLLPVLSIIGILVGAAIVIQATRRQRH